MKYFLFFNLEFASVDARDLGLCSFSFRKRDAVGLWQFSTHTPAVKAVSRCEGGVKSVLAPQLF
jgi:hypothetical protein